MNKEFDRLTKEELDKELNEKKHHGSVKNDDAKKSSSGEEPLKAEEKTVDSDLDNDKAPAEISNGDLDNAAQEVKQKADHKNSEEDSDAFYEEETDSDVDYINDEDGIIEKSRKKKKIRKRLKVVLLIFEIIVLIVGICGFYVVSKIEKVKKVDIQVDDINNNISESVKQNTETGQMKGYKNIALFGVDTRVGELESDTRTDTIVIASINEDTGDIKLVSVYRDTYLNLGNDSYNKCNSAYARGGPQQAINMLNMNLDMNITDFVTIGFGGLVDAIDAIGGLDLTIEEEEISYLNDYEKTMASQLGGEYIPVTEAGYQHLTGLQATAYCRIRYTSGDDFKRTERQRIVLNALFEKAQQATPTQLTQIADSVFDEVYTSMDLTEIIGYLVNITNYSIADQDGFPQENLRSTGTVGRKGSCVIPETLSDNVVWLHHFLFNDYTYEVSDKVIECSDQIEIDTGTKKAQTSTTTTGTTTTTQTTPTVTTDPTTGIITSTDPATGIVTTTNPTTGEVTTTNPTTGETTTTNTNLTTGTQTQTTTDNTGTTDSGTVTATDPTTGQVTTTDPTTGVVSSTDPTTGVVTTVDPNTGVVATTDPTTGQVTYSTTQ